MNNSSAVRWPFIDLFSGCGGFSYGFKERTPFVAVGAIDCEQAKPSSRKGKSGCNESYRSNIGIEPFDWNLFDLSPEQFASELPESDRNPVLLICSPPCTKFSEIRPGNRTIDHRSNSLVGRCADFVKYFRPEFVVLENTPGLITGRHRHHYVEFKEKLEKFGYQVDGTIYNLEDFGLPQARKRAFVIASRDERLRNLHDLWEGWEIDPSSITVRHAIGRLNNPRIEPGAVNESDWLHESPGFDKTGRVSKFIQNIPHDGGSWSALMKSKELEDLVIPSARRRFKEGRPSSHNDVYGRLWWDRPSVTIKRESAHVGNGRYTHPEQDRLLTVREMSILQGFPHDYAFFGNGKASLYRQIGDAVPPMISYQISALVQWMKSGRRPLSPEEWILPNSSLTGESIKKADRQVKFAM